MATSDKYKTSGICGGTEIGSTLGLQMILEAAGHIEEESNLPSQNDIQINSRHFADCFTGSDMLQEANSDGLNDEPCLGLNLDDWDGLVRDSEGNWIPLFIPELDGANWMPLPSPDPELNSGNLGEPSLPPDPELNSGDLDEPSLPPDPELNSGNLDEPFHDSFRNWMLRNGPPPDPELNGGNRVPEISKGIWKYLNPEMPLNEPCFGLNMNSNNWDSLGNLATSLSPT